MKKFNLIDIAIIIAIICVIVVGIFTYKHFRQTGGKQINSVGKIVFQVLLRGVSLTGADNPIRVGDKTFITIRNVPYTALQVVDSRIETKKVSLPSPTVDKSFYIADDYSQLAMYDILVTIVDTAKITDDGAVVGGNKIKMGLPITLEGQTYRFNGVVSNIQLLSPQLTSPESVQAQPQVQEQPQPQVQPQAKTQASAENVTKPIKNQKSDKKSKSAKKGK